MRYTIAPEIFARHPGYVRAVVVGRGLANSADVPAEAFVLLRTAESMVRMRPDLTQPALHERIASWRQAFAAFGARPSRYFSSIEALVRRVRRGDVLPAVNTLVTLANAMSLHYLVPVGAHDLGQARGPLWVRPATGHETFRGLGELEPEQPEPGEFIYVDGPTAAGGVVLCRRWTWRQAALTAVTPESVYVAINVDGLPPVDLAELRGVAGELAGLVQRFCEGAVQTVFLDAAEPSAEV